MSRQETPAIREDAALAFLEAMKERAHAQPGLRFEYSLAHHRQVGVTYCPDMNYGRFQPPHEGLGHMSYRWETYAPAFYNEDAHVLPPQRGWRGLSLGMQGESEALTLLMGGELPEAPDADETDALFAEVAARSAQAAAFEGGPLAHSVFRYTGTRE